MHIRAGHLKRFEQATFWEFLGILYELVVEYRFPGGTPGTTAASSRACHAPPCSPHAPSSQGGRPPRPPSTACTSRRLEGAPSARLTPHANPQPEPGARRRAVDRARPLARCPPPHARSLAACTRTSPDSPLSRAGRAACRTCTPTAAASGPTSATRTSSSRAHRPRLPRLPFASPAQCTSAEGYDRSPRCQRRSDLGCAAPTVRRIECPCSSGSGSASKLRAAVRGARSFWV